MLNFNIRSSFTTRLIVGSLIALFLLSIPVAITAHWILRNNTINQAGVNAWRKPSKSRSRLTVI
ncbi:hypothetical protein BSZ31_05385 [Limnobacter sp. SAORIC-690]|uniref:hypothetical protein n=1 Tax=Limnobacter sp. SAORIC-690 TaxID=1923970 RepID=UPI000CF517C0|nr:hypothetical protein [Limnobacter sp. SAORIC-690]PQJ24483.1 hypothetical protein BSZ31_05385 [Limnobacter sp. SAORIC-690]